MQVNEHIVLVDDDAVVIRLKRALAAVKREGDVKAAAAVLGVEYTRLWKFLRKHDYVVRRELVPKPRARKP